MRKEVRFYFKDGIGINLDGESVDHTKLLGMMVVDYGTDANGNYILFEIEIQD